MTRRVLGRLIARLSRESILGFVAYPLMAVAAVAVLFVASDVLNHKNPLDRLGALTQGASADCADKFMKAVEGPNEQATREAFRCAAPRIQIMMGGSEDAAVASNARFDKTPPAVRAGQSPKLSSGYQFVYYYIDGQRPTWFVVMLDPNGKVLDVE